MAQLPAGTVTFLFTDIEGSTRLAQAYPETIKDTLARHHAILQQAIESHGGYVFQIIGDAFCAAFVTAPDALKAALAAQRALQSEAWSEAGPVRVRMGMHTGIAQVLPDDVMAGQYSGYITLARTQRVMSAGHGGQVLLTQAVYELVRDHLPKDVTLRDLGARRLKDLIRPEQIFQACVPDLPADFAPLKTLDVHPHNLPVQLTSFIGREREMAVIKKLISGTHLLTLTGAGGSGKTRLALQAAADLIDEFPDGVWLVDLAPLSDPAFIPQAIAAALGMRAEGSRPVIDLLADYLRRRELLMVLDNCEHLVEACARAIEQLLQAAPRIKIVATSREELNVAGEKTFSVPALSTPEPAHLPPPESLSQYEAVRLFIERALAVKNDFTVTNANAPAVAQICHRLDGIPLAIELAAARIKAMSPEQIAARLDDRFHLLTRGTRTALPRHQTLRAAVDWSWALLSGNERTLLQRLSVCAGGWSLQSAEVIGAGEGLQSSDVLDLLAQLVSKSLVIWQEEQTEPRYRLLETIREYAHDKLVDAGEEARVRQHHAEFFAQWAEDAASQLFSPQQAAWVTRFDLERDNLRAALKWTLNFQPISTLRIANALADSYWYWRDAYAEGVQWYERAFPVVLEAPIEARAYALLYTAHFALQLGRTTEYAEEGLQLARQSNDKILLPFALGILGATKLENGDSQGAAACFEEALPLAQSTQSPRVLPMILKYMGWVRVGVSEYDQAESYFQQAADVDRTWNLKDGLTECLWNLGDLAFLRGDLDKARTDLTEGLALAIDLQQKTWIGHMSETLGRVKILDGELDHARRLLTESLHMHQDLGRKSCMAHNLEGWARLAMAQGNPQRAARLLGALTMQLNRLGMSLIPLLKALYEQTLASVQQQLDEAAFKVAWAAGQQLTLEQAVAYALEETPA